MPLKSKGSVRSVPGFSQQTFTHVKQDPAVSQSLIKSDLLEFENSTQMPDNLNLKMAIAKAYITFLIPDRQKVKMLHLNDLFSRDLDIWSESPSLPWTQWGYKNKGDIKKDPEAIRKVRHFWHRVKAGDDIRPPNCLAYVDSHICPEGEHKVQAVWEYPATVTFGEAVFALPLLEHYKRVPSPFYEYETAVGGMRKIVLRYNNFKHFAGLSFKKFDKLTPTWLIKKAFLILESNVNFVEYDDHGIADARRMFHMWKYIEDYFINTPIRTATGHRYRKRSGIASGSYFTQLIRSISNYILCQWMCLEQNGGFAEDIIVQGDDSLIVMNTVLSLKKCEELMHSIGMQINLEKSQITTELQTMKFLGYRIGQKYPK